MKALQVGIALALLAGALWFSYSRGEAAADLRWKATWADQVALQAKARAAAEGNARAEEQRRQNAVDEVSSDAKKQIEAVAVDAAGADAAGQRLHAAADKLAAGAGSTCGDPGVTQRGQAATRAAMVLSDLLKRADQRAGELAAAYDHARVAGLACEAAYDRVRNTKH